MRRSSISDGCPCRASTVIAAIKTSATRYPSPVTRQMNNTCRKYRRTARSTIDSLIALELSQRAFKRALLHHNALLSSATYTSVVRFSLRTSPQVYTAPVSASACIVAEPL